MESKCPCKPGFDDVEDCPDRRPLMVSNTSKCCWQRRRSLYLVLLSFLLLVASMSVLLFIVTGFPTNSRRLVIEVTGDSGNGRGAAASIGGSNVGGMDQNVWHEVMSLFDGNLKETGTFLAKKENNGTLTRLLQLLKTKVGLSRGSLGSNADEDSGNNIGNLNVFSINVINSNNNNNNNDNDDDSEDSDNNVNYAKNKMHMTRNNVLNVVKSFDGDKVGNDNNSGNNNDDDNIIIGGRKGVLNATAAAEETTGGAE